MVGARSVFVIVFACFLICGCTSEGGDAENEWISLFNGEDLSGWTVKITGSEIGDDPLNTFRVEDGLLTVGYENYDEFGNRFGHIFYEEPFSHYLLRVEYRFVGEQIPGGPSWAFKNSGVMFHSQSPQSMLKDQDFPISIEAQFLGGNGTDDRPTANLCTPGTHVVIDDLLVEDHCINSSAPTYHGEEWVTFDLLVLGNSKIAHIIGQDTVMAYSLPVMGGGVVNGYDEAIKVDGIILSDGYIALQSESHPIQFRKVQLKELSASQH